MRIAIVNDMAIAVEALRRVIVREPDYQVAWVARNGEEAVEQCKRDTPDLILMDLMMPVMDGAEATRRIMNDTPCPILIVTSAVEANSVKVFEALGSGALDAVQTPFLGETGETAGASALKFKIEDWTVTLDSSTVFTGGSCTSVAVGKKLGVKGTVTADHQVLATRIVFKDNDAN